MPMPTRSALSTAIACCLLANATHALAQESNNDEDSDKATLEVIMVSAQKRTQSVKEVPLSITAVSGELLNNLNINDTEALASRLANFEVSQSGQGFNISMRGLGSGPNQGFEQTVGTYVDGVYRGRAHQMRSAFLDLERFEVLRGPQSTLFGRNTTAGALNITTARPTEALSGYSMATYEIDNGLTFDGAISSALTEKIQARAALKVIDQDGLFYNSLAQRDEVGRDGVFGRVTFTAQPTDTIDLTLIYQKDDEQNIGITPSLPLAEPALFNAPLPPLFSDVSSYQVGETLQKGRPELGENEFGDYQAQYLTFNAEWQADNFVLTSVTGWQEYTMDQANDGDHGPAPLTYRQQSREQFEQLSQELRITSTLDGDFNYIAGAYYQTTELDFTEAYRLYPLNAVGPRRFATDADTWALFAQFDYQLSADWKATLGVRYSEEDRDASRQLNMIELSSGTPIQQLDIVDVPAALQAMGVPPQVPRDAYLNILQTNLGLEVHDIQGQRTEKEFAPSLILSRKISAGMLYGSVSTGDKAGGFDARANLARDWEFDPESVLAYELGAKLTLLDASLDLNIAAFVMQFDDLQTSTFDGVAGFFVENGGESTSQGLELDSRWIVSDDWQLSGNVAYLDFEWDEFSGAKCFNSATLIPDNVEANGVTCNFAGKTGAFAPKWSGSMRADYYAELGDSLELNITLESVFKSRFYTNYDLNPFTAQGGFAKFNLRAALADYDNNWSVALIGKNLTDRITTTFSTDMSFAPAGLYASWVEPGRTVSLQASYQW